MNDQANAVDPETALLAALGDEDPVDGDGEVIEEDSGNEGKPAKSAPEAKDSESPEESADEPAKYLITVKNEKGDDEEREISVDELAKGYMLQADYTRKTQEVSDQRRNLEVQFTKALQDQQSQAVDRINQLQELVLSQAAPELNGVDWVSLSVQDPQKYVQLQARQQQVNHTLQALEQQKAQHQQAQEQQLAGLVDQVFKQSDEILRKSIPNLDGESVGKLLTDVQKSIGWSGDDIRMAARALAQAGMHPGTLGQVLLLAHKAMQFDRLNTDKPAALKKVAAAPRIIKPSAPQPTRTNREAVQRLQRSGSVDDLARLL